MADIDPKPLQFRVGERDVWREMFRLALTEPALHMKPHDAMRFADACVIALRERTTQKAEG